MPSHTYIGTGYVKSNMVELHLPITFPFDASLLWILGIRFKFRIWTMSRGYRSNLWKHFKVRSMMSLSLMDASVFLRECIVSPVSLLPLLYWYITFYIGIKISLEIHSISHELTYLNYVVVYIYLIIYLFITNIYTG